MDLIQINKCPPHHLMEIPGVGPKIMERIVLHRDLHGHVTPEFFACLGIKDLPTAMSRVDFSPCMPLPGDLVDDSAASKEEREREFMDKTIKVIEQRQNQASSSSGDRKDQPTASTSSTSGSKSSTSLSGPSASLSSKSPSPGAQSYAGPRYGLPDPYAYAAEYERKPFINWERQPMFPLTQIDEFARQGYPAGPYHRHDMGWRQPPQMDLRGDPAYDQPRSRSLNVPRSISFDGKSDWKAFITKFNTYADREGWNSSARRDALSWILEGTASEYYSRLVERDPNMDYFEVVDKMARRFDKRELPETIQMHFAYATQQSKESLQEWGERALTMAMQGYPDMSDSQIYKQAVLRFCQGCQDKEAGLYALTQKPQSIEEALDRVKWFQVSNQAIYGQGRSRREVRSIFEPDYSHQIRAVEPRQNQDREKKQVRFQERSGRSSPSPDLKLSQRMDSLEKKVDELAESIKVLADSIKRRPRSRSPAKTTGCFKCGQEGHWKVDCKADIKDKKVNAVDLIDAQEEEPFDEEALNDSGSEC